MNQDVAALQIRLEATTARFERQLQRADRAMRTRTRTMSRNAEKLDDKLSKVGDKFGVGLAVRAGAVAVALATVARTVNDVVRNGDKFRLLEARFTAVTGSAERGAEAFQNVLKIVEETGVGIDDAANSVSRFTLAAESIGATDSEVRQLTENVIKLGQVGGASGQELSSGATQLAQALASGRLQGDELRSILENMPLVAKAIADGLGVGVGQLREMGAEGELTSRKVFDAMLSKTDEIQDAFEQLPVTLDRAAGQLAGSWAVFTAELDRSLGVSEALVSVIESANSGLVELLENRKRIAAFEASINAPPPIDRATLTPRSSSGVSAGALNSIAEGMDFAEVGRVAGIAAAREAAAAADGAFGGSNNSAVSVGRPVSARRRRSRGGGGRGGRSARVDTESAARMVQAVRGRVQALNEERGALGLVGQELGRYRAGLEAARIESALLELAGKENTVVTQEQAAEIRSLADQYLILAENIEREKEAIEAQAKATEDAARKQEDLAKSISSTGDKFVNAVKNADSFQDALKNIGLQLLELAANAALGQGPLGGLFNDLIGVGAGGVLGLLGGGAAPTSSPIPVARPFANGAAFSQGRVTPFATGGIVNGPTTFPMANGTGLMGEAGPEAIMPLARGPGGKLGVVASGGGAGTVVVSPTYNISGLGLSGAEVQALMQRNNRDIVGTINDRLDRGN